MAAPHVAGSFAILKQIDPGATVTSLVSLLQSTGDPVEGFCVPNPTQRRVRVDRAAAGGAIGACCHDQTCTIESGADCAALSGSYLGDDTRCADGVESAAFSYELFPNVNIPDNGGFTSSAVSNINVTQNVTVGKVTVQVEVNHSWVGDVLARVTHGSYNVIVFSADVNCDADNFDVTLDDDATGGPIDWQCTTNLTSPPSYYPGESLTTFQGMNASGNWQLRVGDFGSQDTGQLLRWKLIIEPQQQPCAGVIYVNANATGLQTGMDWANAFVDLQDALDFATGTSLQEIWVASAGGFAYTPDRGTGNRFNAFAVKPKLAVYGGFAGNESAREQRNPAVNETILGGDLNGDDGPSFANRADNSYHVVDGGAGDSESVVDGFTIQGGNADGVFRGAGNITSGGAVYVSGGAFAVANCRLSDNYALTGGAIAGDSAAVVSVDNCVIVANAAADGGALHADNASVDVTDSLLVGNAASPGAGGGAVLTNSATGDFVNCAFSGNSASTDGGALYIDYSLASIVNCTFAQNVAGGDGGGIRAGVDPGDPIPVVLLVDNSIFWNNEDSGGTDESAQVFTFSGYSAINFSDVHGGWTGGGGTGNINADPIFADADGADDAIGTSDDDVSIQATSPCVDAADNSVGALSGVITDLAGNDRFVDDQLVADTGNGVAPIVDMGAYERQVPQCQFDGQLCDDGDYCTVNDICSGGLCSGGPRDCSDGNACTSDVCNSGLATCQNPPAGGPCDDSNYCTVNDTCLGGACMGAPRDCSDGNVCTQDTCNAGLSICEHTPIANSCNDNDACTINDICSGTVCAGSPLNCDDSNPCTDDSCNSAVGCEYVNNDATCEDNNICTVGNCTGGSCGVYVPRKYADLFEPLNGLTDVDDLICLLEAFANGLAECPLADIAPCEGSGGVDVDDLINLLEAFAGNFLCPDPCP